ncbi:unannotated protein [freshwater metagenome]|uniref:Unannotated protein n=1 Tax=freshwater metagenome TaxID=449393 RepID=A0A6J7P680_9ZZZZ
MVLPPNNFCLVRSVWVPSDPLTSARKLPVGNRILLPCRAPTQSMEASDWAKPNNHLWRDRQHKEFDRFGAESDALHTNF